MTVKRAARSNREPGAARKAWAGGLVLAALAIAAWLLMRPEAPSGNGRTAAEAPRPMVLPERANALLTAPLPPPKGDRVIRGMVVGPDGPVAGAIVVASADGGEEVLSDLPCRCDSHCGQRLLECGCDGAATQLVELVLERRGEAPPIARATSGADGSFTLSGLEDGVFALWADEPGKLIGVLRGVPAGEEDAKVEVSQGITLRGRTVGDEGKPVAATVTAIYAEHSRFFDAVSGPDGVFAIGPVPTGDFSVVAAAAGLLPSHGRASTSEPDLRELKLFSPRRIAGVVSQDGNPARATVSLEGWHKKLKVEADEKGHFEFSGLKPLPYELIAAAGLAQAQEKVALKAGKDVLDVQMSLSRGGEIVGKVRSESGGAIADAEVKATGQQQRSQRTGPDGRYRLGPLPAAKYTVSVEAEGFLEPENEEVELAQGATATWEVALRPASPLKGRVVGEDGKPVESATVMAIIPEQPEADDEAPTHREHTSGNATTRHDGGFFVDGLVPGRYEVTVVHNEYRDQKLTLTAPTTEARIVLSHGLEIVGTVVDEEDKPVVGANVTAEVDLEGKEGDPANHGSTKLEASGVRGEFRIRGLEAGHFRVTATLGTWRTFGRITKAKVDLLPGARASVRLKFEKGLTISGTVVTKAGKPVAEARVRAMPDVEGGEGAVGKDMAERSSLGLTTTGEDGTFVVNDLEPGAYELTAFGAAGGADEPVKANAGDHDVKLVLEGGGKVRGRVVQASGEPVTHFKIDRMELRDDQGAFEVPARSPGEQRLVVEADGFAEVTARYEAKGGEDVDLGAVVLGKGRPVSGKVLDAQSGDPIANALVDAGDVEQQGMADLQMAIELGAVKTLADGSFTLPHVDARPRAIFAAHATHLLTSQPLPADVSTVTLRMERGASVTGIVTDAAGKPIAQAMIMARSAQGSHRASTGADGRYRLGPVPPGPVTLAVLAHGQGAIPGRTIDAPAGGEVQADFRESSGGVHLVMVMPGQEFPMLAPGDVPLPKTQEDYYRLTLTAIQALPLEDHSFEAKTVAPGQYTLFILAQGSRATFKVARQQLQIGAEPEQKMTVPQPAEFSEIKLAR